MSRFIAGVTYCRSCRSVIVQPGETALTRMRRGPNSRASARVKPRMPIFVATYAVSGLIEFLHHLGCRHVVGADHGFRFAGDQFADESIVGWIADSFGPRWALGFGATSGFAATIVGLYYLSQYRLQTHIDAGRLIRGQPPVDLDSSHRATIEQKIT